MTEKKRRGRFAPSPTGPLHFGSLVAAVGSYLMAKNQGGEWLLRIDDLDQTRSRQAAIDSIFYSLQSHGLLWDGEVYYQSKQQQNYQQAITLLSEKQLIYYCSCSRKLLRESEKLGRTGIRYSGRCRGRTTATNDCSIRILTTADELKFADLCQGYIRQRIETEVGDFTIKRRDGFFAYQLAVVVDDNEQGITDVVRGSDLLDSTARQIYLQKMLDMTTPSYLHLPIAVNPQGEKISKLTAAPAIDNTPIADNLVKTLTFLGHPPPPDLHHESAENLLHWALSNWSLANIPSTRKIIYE